MYMLRAMTANGRSCFNYNHSGVKLWYQLSHWLIIHLYLGTSLVTSCPCPPAENILWFDLNFLSLTLSHLECEMTQMSNEFADYTIESCSVIEVQNGHLDLFWGLAIFVQKTVHQCSVVLKWRHSKPSYKQSLWVYLREGCHQLF